MKLSLVLLLIVASLQSSYGNQMKTLSNWTLINTEHNINIENLTLPISVHTALLNSGLIKDPFYRFNDINLRWIVYDENWVFKNTFYQSFNESSLINLEFDSIDTIASVYLNGKYMLAARNQFLKYELPNISSLLNNKMNILEVKFSSPVRQAKYLAGMYPYRVPVECPPVVQKGECHVNFLRKQQCSFSWDWGPAFAPVGLNGNVNLKVIEKFDFGFSVSIQQEDNFNLKKWIINSNLRILNGKGLASINLKINELSFEFKSSFQVSSAEMNKKILAEIYSDELELWWPNGLGDQKLYNLSIVVTIEDVTVTKFKNVGFRSVELIQIPVPVKDKGLTFYFKINRLPIFLKGSNWIPAHVFQEAVTSEYLNWLMNSAKEANMNVLRVWGGGVYERDEFYELADKLGIMIWQDFMFACSTYPTNEDYLSNVKDEVSYQINRLRNHPSIIIWAGNNENEAAISTNWYNTTNNQTLYENDYRKLYIDVIKNIVQDIDPEISRPFLSSSPTNGLETIAENWIAKNPYDSLYGDQHFYDYTINGWLPESFKVPRFMSEYGVQSLPSYSTLSKVYSMPDDAEYFGKLNEHRQHHGDGNQQIINAIEKNLKIPNCTDQERNLKNIIYLSQINQAMTLKTATELFRRKKNVIDSETGIGNCRGSMYWQFNDVWQAPTWSTIEFMSSNGINMGGKWKLGHYYIKNAYENVILQPVLKDNLLKIYANSDLKESFKSSFTLKLFSFDNFTEKISQSFSFSVDPFSMSLAAIYKFDFDSVGCNKKSCVIDIESNDPSFKSRNFAFLDHRIDLKNLTKPPKIEFVINDTSTPGLFSIQLKSTSIAFFVYLDMSTTDFYGTFSENGFHMTRHEYEVFYKTGGLKVTVESLNEHLNVQSLADIYF